MEVAVKYQYNSATAFSRAFEKFHGIKPSKVKEMQHNLKVFSKLYFEENKIDENSMEYSIIEKKEMILYGVGIRTNKKDIKIDAPKFFKEASEKYEGKYGEIPYGMVVYENRFKSVKFEYWVLYDYEVPEKEFKKYIIPSSKWLSFKINSQDSKMIQKISQDFYNKFIKSVDFSIKSLPELEYYHDNITEFLVPIEII